MQIIVYKIYCKKNGKSYIGITDNFKRRFAVHWHDVKRNSQTVLCRSIRKYGKENFVISKIDNANSWEEACEKERQYIKSLNTKVPSGMNMTDGGDGIFGHVMSLKTRKQMSESHKGKGVGRDNPMFGKSGPMLGKMFSKEHRKRISDSKKNKEPWNKGKKCPQLSGKNNAFYGKHHTEKTKRKMSEAATGRKMPAEVRSRMSKTRKGKYVGEKHSQSTLTNNKVLKIRELYDLKEFNQAQLGKKFNVTQSMISCIIRRKSWKHI